MKESQVIKFNVQRTDNEGRFDMKKMSFLASVAMAGMVLLLGGCGGDGDDGNGEGGTELWPSGTCDICQTVADCEDGLVCQSCEGDCEETTKRCCGLSTASSGTLTCSNTSFPAGCVNIAGSWTISESIQGECTIDGESDDLNQEGTAVVNFVQNGCDVQYTIESEGVSLKRSGKIVGNRMRLTGPFLVAIVPGVSFGRNLSIVDGTVDGDRMDLTGTAEGDGNIQGQGFTCSGTSTATGTR